MQRFLVKVWAGNADHRWNTQDLDVIAGSSEEASSIVAEDLCLPSGSWQGDNPPFELAVHTLGDMPAVENSLAGHEGHSRLVAAVRARYNRFIGVAVGNTGRPIRAPV